MPAIVTPGGQVVVDVDELLQSDRVKKAGQWAREIVKLHREYYDLDRPARRNGTVSSPEAAKVQSQKIAE